MTETIQVVDAGDLICNLKAAVTALECQHKMDLAREKLRRKVKKPPPAPMFMMIPLEQKGNDEGSDCENRMQRTRKHRHERDSSGDYGDSVSNDSRRTSYNRRDDCKENNGPTMRGGVLHSRCGCVHRDGLQDSCPLTECRGHPDCLVKPWAVCPPARYFRARFPEMYPAPPNPDAITF